MRGAQPHGRVSLSRNVWSHVLVSAISAGVNYPGRQAVPGGRVVFPPRIGSSGASATGRSPRGSRLGFLATPHPPFLLPLVENGLATGLWGAEELPCGHYIELVS